MPQHPDPEKRLVILILRTIGMSQDQVVSILHCHKSTIGDSEKWLQNIPYNEAVAFCSEIAVKEVVNSDLVPTQIVNRDELVRAAQVTTDAILRRHRTDYMQQQIKPPRKLSSEEQEVIRHQQLEHIGKVQSLARSTVELYSTNLHRHPFTISPPTSATVTISYYDSERASITHNYDALISAFHYLVGHAFWPYLAAHLGNKAEKVECFASRFIAESMLFTGQHSELSIEELKLSTAKAQKLIDGSLAIMAQTSDVSEWKQHGCKSSAKMAQF